MPKNYVLLQDTPSHEKGEEFYYKDLAKCYCSVRTAKGFQLMLPPEFVENNPEWFKLKEEKAWTDSDMIEFSYNWSSVRKDFISESLQALKDKNLIAQQNSKL